MTTIVAELRSLLVKPDALLLSLQIGEAVLDLQFAPAEAREIAHIIADALHSLDRGPSGASGR
ncbi:MAG: hypothetical protein M9883_10110 [Methylobacteriaceae bacterium]|nr:hypothetical protein [Methylobacteriaceae bacterium]